MPECAVLIHSYSCSNDFRTRENISFCMRDNRTTKTVCVVKVVLDLLTSMICMFHCFLNIGIAVTATEPL